MSAEWQTQAAESWKLTLPCTRTEAEAIAACDDPLPGFDPAPVLLTSEPDPAAPEAWRLEVYCEGPPPPDLLDRLRVLVPAAGGMDPIVVRIEDEDWVTKSQAWLAPIDAGRFHVHTAAHAGRAPAGSIAFHIEAGRAFGTGHHETTTGCLELLDRLERAGRRYMRVADIGTGTGLLAFAARALWPDATILASDIDAISIEVTAANMAANIIPAAAIELVVANGTRAAAIAAAAPFDLVIANILAAPLVAMAPELAAVTAPGGTIMLAGLLASQEESVLDAYRDCGFVLADRLQRGDWPTLALVQHG